MVLVATESYFLTNTLLLYVRSQDYFTPPWQTLVTISVLLLLVLYTYTLTVGAWGKWEQYVVVPFPICTGIFLSLLFLNPAYALLIATGAYFVISYDVWVSTNITRMLIHFDPRTVLRFSNRGVLFTFALLAGVITFLHPSLQTNQFDFGGKLAEITQAQVNSILRSQASTTQDQMGLTGFPLELSAFNLDLRSTLKAQIDQIIAPYQQFIPPLIALLVYVLIRFLGSVANFVFNGTASILFKIAKSFGLFHVLHVQVEKEVLSFSAPSQP